MEFFQEFKKLAFSHPRSAIHSRIVHNGEFGDYLYRSKNIYLSYFLADAEDCFYSEYLSKCRDCVDSAYLTNCELCHECIDCSGIYNGSFLQDCHNCSNIDFCSDCMNCKECFGCVGLRQQQFCIFNKSYPEDIYRKKVTHMKKNSIQKILEILQPEFKKQPRLYARLLKGGEQSFGDYIYFSRNCYECFNIRNATDCAYVSEIMDPELPSSDSIDCTYVDGIDGCYDCLNVHGCSNSSFLFACRNCSDSEYLIDCYNCQNCFGCVYMTNKQFCILNRQFTREEYFIYLQKLKIEMKKSFIHGKTLADILK